MNITRLVAEIIDGDTFKVTPDWVWNQEKGDTVRPVGYDAPEEGEPGFEEAKRRLKNLIEGKHVELRNPVNYSYGRLLCDVFFNGKNLKDYFPEYQ